MKLRTRVLLILGTVAVAFVVIEGVARETMIRSRFRTPEIERDLAEAGLRRVRNSIQRRIEGISAICRLVEGQVQERPLSREAFDLRQVAESQGLHVVFVIGEEGGVRGGIVLSPSTGEPVTLKELPSGAWSEGHPLLQPRSKGGFLDTSLGPLLCAVGGLSFQGDAPQVRVVAGRFADEEFEEELSLLVEAPVRFFSLRSDEVNPLLEEVMNAGEPVVEATAHQTLKVSDAVHDLWETPTALVSIELDHQLAALGERVARETMLSNVAAASLVLLMLAVILQRSVIGPVQRLTEHAEEIRRTNDITLRIGSKRRDELGVLAREFDEMVSELERSRWQQMKMARAAGVSEVATGVLHNLGNMMNSVHVSMHTLRGMVGNRNADDLDAVVEQLELHKDALDHYLTRNPRGKHALPFLSQLRSEVLQNRAATLEELGALHASVDRMTQILQAQEQHASRTIQRAWTCLSDPVEQAIEVVSEARSAERVVIDKDLRSVRRLETDSYRLVDILVSLMLNAFSAMQRARVGEPRLVLRTWDEQGRSVIEVEDNGVGIEEEDIERVFELGFSKTPGGLGYGLHMAATAAMEMGGHLSAPERGTRPGRDVYTRLRASGAVLRRGMTRP